MRKTACGTRKAEVEMKTFGGVKIESLYELIELGETLILGILGIIFYHESGTQTF
jgi:hypothetical protein